MLFDVVRGCSKHPPMAHPPTVTLPSEPSSLPQPSWAGFARPPTRPGGPTPLDPLRPGAASGHAPPPGGACGALQLEGKSCSGSMRSGALKRAPSPRLSPPWAHLQRSAKNGNGIVQSINAGHIAKHLFVGVFPDCQPIVFHPQPLSESL